MSSEQIKGLLNVDQEVESPSQPVELPSQSNEAPVNAEQAIDRPESPAPQQPAADDKTASEILSAPPPDPAVPEPIGGTAVLKTRKDLIQKISEICERRGEDPKPLNLKRRRKKSLEGILAQKFAEAAEAEQRHEVHPELENVLPEGMQARTQFAVDMAFRLDLTLCSLLEKGVSATDGWHGLSADGYARSIETNDTLTSEIKQCWLEIINEPENEWILDACTSGTRLFLCHFYGLMNVLHKKKQHVSYENIQKVTAPPGPRFQADAMPNVAPRGPSGKLRRIARERAARRENDIAQGAVYSGARSVAKEV